MAITFSKSLSVTKLLNAHNNSVVEFTSTTLTATKCTITIAGSASPFIITPINNVFSFNFKDILKALINQGSFQDETTPILVLADPTSHVYDATANTYIAPLVTYTISDGTTTDVDTYTYKWLNSVEQIEQNKVGVVTGTNAIYVLSPFQQATANTYDVTYFEGYPFDVSIYLNTPGIVTILNQTNALSYNFTLPDTVNRLFFSDGRLTITLADYLPLVDGLNALKITSGTDIININVTKRPSIDGHYLKWINQYGGWSYWLFNCIHKRARKTKSLGSVFSGFDNVASTTSFTKSLGIQSNDILTLIADDVDTDDQAVLNQLTESPKVYFFTGTRLTQVNPVSWLSVDIKNMTTNIINYKDTKMKYKLNIELPERYTMKL